MKRIQDENNSHKFKTENAWKANLRVTSISEFILLVFESVSSQFCVFSSLLFRINRRLIRGLRFSLHLHLFSTNKDFFVTPSLATWRDDHTKSEWKKRGYLSFTPTFTQCCVNWGRFFFSFRLIFHFNNGLSEPSSWYISQRKKKFERTKRRERDRGWEGFLLGISGTNDFFFLSFLLFPPSCSSPSFLSFHERICNILFPFAPLEPAQFCLFFRRVLRSFSGSEGREMRSEKGRDGREESDEKRPLPVHNNLQVIIPSTHFFTVRKRYFECHLLLSVAPFVPFISYFLPSDLLSFMKWWPPLHGSWLESDSRSGTDIDVKKKESNLLLLLDTRSSLLIRSTLIIFPLSSLSAFTLFPNPFSSQFEGDRKEENRRGKERQDCLITFHFFHLSSFTSFEHSLLLVQCLVNVNF